MLGQLQLGWLLLALARHRGARARRPLRRLAADLQVHVGGGRASRSCSRRSCSAADVNGARLTLSIGPLSGQPSELLKVILVVFLAGYLSENRSLLADESTRIGPIQAAAAPVPRADGRDGRDRAVDRRRPARPRRRAAVLRRVPRAAVRGDRPAESYVRRRAWSCSSSGSMRPVQPVRPRPAAGRQLARPVRATRWASGFQIVQALYAFARGGLLGVGLGQRPADDRRAPADPRRPHRLPARGAGRGAGPHRPARDPRPVPRGRASAGCGSPPRAHDDFRALLAAGLALVVGVQAFIIAAGNLKLIPLTGITLPFISYGGSSLLANAVVVGLLLALSDRGRSSRRRRRATRRRRLRRVPPYAAGRVVIVRRDRRAARRRRRARPAVDRRRTCSAPASRSPARSRSSRSAPATGRSSRPSGCRPRPTTRPSSRSPGARSAARSSTATAAGSPAASATPTARRSASTATTRISHVVGYASRQYGTAGLERAYNAELIGLVRSGRRSAGCWASSTRRPTSRWASRLTLDLRLQRAAVRRRWATTGARS